MKKKKYEQKKGFVLSTLAVSLLLMSHHAFALEDLGDHDLRQINGQDGLAIDLAFDKIHIDELYWDDHAGRQSGSSDLRTKAADVELKTKQAANSNDPIVPVTTSLHFNTGSRTDGITGLDLDISTSPFLLSVEQFSICSDTSGAAGTCTAGIGNLALQTTSPLEFKFKTRDGLFHRTSQSELEFGVKNANIYLGQTDATGKLNQLVFHDSNFNFRGKGVMFVDKDNGFIMQTNADGITAAGLTQTSNTQYGYVDLLRTRKSFAPSFTGHDGSYSGSDAAGAFTTGSGLNLEFMLRKNVSDEERYKLNDITAVPEGAKGLIRIGASGRMVNSSLQLRGVNTTAAGATDPLGRVNGGAATQNIMGNSGIALRLKTDFTKTGDSMLAGGGEATALEIGGAGLNTYGFEFGELTGLMRETRGSFDSGDIFINLVDSKSIKLLTDPATYNYTLVNSRLGSNPNARLVTAADYTQDVYTGTTHHNSVVMAIRGAEFQAFSRKGRFTNSAGIASNNRIQESGDNNTWGLALPFYNLNANLAMYSKQTPANQASYFDKDGVKHTVGAASETTPRLGLSIAMSTDGVDRDENNKAIGSKTTSILILDGENNYYFGLRNIDMLLKGVGELGVENGSVNVSFPQLLIAMSAQVGGGKLPVDYTSTSCAAIKKCTSFGDFLTNSQSSDILTELRLRLAGEMDFSLLPTNDIADGGALSIVGEFNMLNTQGNTIQIVDPFNQSMVGLDNIVGRLQFNNQIKISKVEGKTQDDGRVNFNTALTFNPNRLAQESFRIKDINFYPPNQSGQRLGELAIPGGRLSSELAIVPRNGAF